MSYHQPPEFLVRLEMTASAEASRSFQSGEEARTGGRLVLTLTPSEVIRTK